MNLISLIWFFYAFNLIPFMVMLITPRVIAKMDKIAIFAIMAAIVMANGNLSMAIRGIPLKGMKKKLSDEKLISICFFFPFRHYQYFL